MKTFFNLFKRYPVLALVFIVAVLFIIFLNLNILNDIKDSNEQVSFYLLLLLFNFIVYCCFIIFSLVLSFKETKDFIIIYRAYKKSM